MWLLFAILAPVCWGFANPIDSALRRGWLKDDLVMTSVFAITKLPVAICMLILFGSGIVMDWPVLWMFCQGFIWMLAFTFYYKAIKIEEISRVVLIMQFQPIIMLFLASLLLGEKLSMHQVFAFILMFIGSLLASLKIEKSKWHFSKAFVFMMIGNVLWSFADVMFKKYVVYFPNFWAGFGVDLLGSSVVGALLFMLPKYRNILGGFKFSKLGWSFLFASATLGVFGSFAFAYALTLGKASLTSVIIGLQPLFALVSGLVLHKFLPEVPTDSVRFRDVVVKGLSFVLIISGLISLYF